MLGCGAQGMSSSCCMAAGISAPGRLAGLCVCAGELERNAEHPECPKDPKDPNDTKYPEFQSLSSWGRGRAQCDSHSSDIRALPSTSCPTAPRQLEPSMGCPCNNTSGRCP